MRPGSDIAVSLPACLPPTTTHVPLHGYYDTIPEACNRRIDTSSLYYRKAGYLFITAPRTLISVRIMDSAHTYAAITASTSTTPHTHKRIMYLPSTVLYRYTLTTVMVYTNPTYTEQLVCSVIASSVHSIASVHTPIHGSFGYAFFVNRPLIASRPMHLTFSSALHPSHRSFRLSA